MILNDKLGHDCSNRELWLGSLNAGQWWESTEAFGKSCAVMSVIGYVIGLGDRHLDNVLVDLHSGEVKLKNLIVIIIVISCSLIIIASYNNSTRSSIASFLFLVLLPMSVGGSHRL